MNKNARLLIILIVVLIASQSVFLYFLNSHVEELKSNPFVYGAKKYQEMNGGEVTCTCLVENRGMFYVNSTGVRQVNKLLG